MTGLTQQLGIFVHTLQHSDAPGDALRTAKVGFADCFAVMIAGQQDKTPSIVDRLVASADGAEKASVIPSGATRNAEDAALINGVAAHVLDYDDVTLDGHPSAVLVPAILAQAEVSGSTGTEMLLAYVAGYEVWAELLMREPDPLHQKGWHPTAIRGTVAAAAACARLRRLDAAHTATAMSISASMTGGLVANFGSQTKCFQVGRAAQSGVLAARLAEAGFTAAPDALEHPSGLLAATSPQNHPDLDCALEPGRKIWYLERQGLNIKRYPICYGTHRAIDAALDIVRRGGVNRDNISKILVHTGEMQMVMLRNERPRSGLEAKFSMPFAMASAIVAKRVGLAQLTDDFVRRSDVQDLFPKVSYELTKETLNGSAFAPEESVEIVTTSGETIKSDKIKYAKGSHQRPLTEQELREKFDDCLGADIRDDKKKEAFDRLINLEQLTGTSDLLSLV
jgi:2-methylcitrate dehydratase PrpD